MTPPTPQRIENPVRESVRVLGLYLRAQFLIAVILTALYAIGFALAHVPFWPVIAIIGGLTSLIPRVGPLFPIALAVLAIVLGGWNLEHFLAAFVAWIAIQFLEGFVITPTLLSKPLGLKPLPVFFAVLAGSFVFGPIGLFLAVPILAVGAVFYRWFRRKNASIREHSPD